MVALAIVVVGRIAFMLPGLVGAAGTREAMNHDDVLDEVLAAEEEADRAEDEPPGDEPAGMSEEEADPDARRGLDVPDEALLAPPERTRVPFSELSAILGVPLFYERTANPGPRRFSVAPGFVPILRRTVKQIRERAPAGFGELERIVSAGMFVDKPGMHGRGLACDWDRVVFNNVEIAPIERDHASSSLATRQRYWALGALLRSNACFVLHGKHDADHADHFHQDHSVGVAFNRQHSTVSLTQAVLNDIWGASPKLVVDGDFGEKTAGALAKVFQRIGLPNDVDDVRVWQRFLRRSGRLGFRLSVG
jgi:hypothetical protein